MTKIRECYKETEIGVIPEDWEVCKVDDVISFLKSGLSRKLSDSDIGIPCLRSSNIIDGRLKLDDLKYWFIEDPQGAKIEDYIVDEGDILVNFINSIAQIGKACIFDNPTFRTIYTTNVFRIKTDSEIMDNKFFFYNTQTKSYSYQISLITKPAVNQASFTTGDFKSIKFPIPSLPEQQRIAEILSTADSHIEKLDKTIEDYQLLKKGMMKKLLTEGIGHTEFKETEIGMIPKEWEVVKLSEIASLITKGTTPSTYGYNFTESGVNFIKVENIFPSGFIDIDSTPKISDECNAKLSRSIILESDILVSIAGTIGRSAIVDKTHLPANTNQALAIIRLKDTLKTAVKYINYTFSSSYFMSYISSIKTVGAQPNMSLKQLNDNLIALPDVEEQRKISLVLNELDNRIRQYEYLRNDFDKLKKSLMEKLLTGKVRVM